jgi:vacuolar-type H+-ATPase subunit I/STV1
VLYFHQRLGHKTYEISKSELKSARELIQKYGTKFTKYIVDYAIGQIKDNKAESSVRSFGYVMSFVNEAIESYTKEQQEKEKEKEVEQKIKQREETDKEREKYLSKFRDLQQEQQEEIRNKAIEILIQQGVPKKYLFERIIEDQIIELIKQGAAK